MNILLSAVAAARAKTGTGREAEGASVQVLPWSTEISVEVRKSLLEPFPPVTKNTFQLMKYI